MPRETFHRPPRDYPPRLPPTELTIAGPPVEPPPQPGSMAMVVMPVVGSMGMLAFAVVYRNKAFLYVALALAALMLLMGLGLRWGQRRQARRRNRQDRARWRRHLADRERELKANAETQRAAAALLYPEPGRLWTLALKGERLWERRRADADFLDVRLGTGTVELARPVRLEVGSNPLTPHQADLEREARKVVEHWTKLRGEPVVVGLRDAGVVCLTGERERSRAVARSILCQLATFRAPQDLRIGAAFAAADLAEWEWLKWLPHARADRAAGPGLLAADTPERLASLLADEVQPRIEQSDRLEAAGSEARASTLRAPHLVLVVDGFRPDAPVMDLALFRELLVRGPQLQVTLVLLVDARELEPSDIGARLTLPPRTRAAFEVAGPGRERIDDIQPDAVDAGTAEAIARALSPLRLQERAGELDLSAPIRLLDLIDAPPGRLRAPLGIADDGRLVVLDLKESAEGGMGPHGLIIGATGSGKSELLRTLVTSLALGHDPDELAFVLIDFKGGAAFAELARLPHAAGLITNLQSDLSLVDRAQLALAGEMERRQALLRRAGNLDDIRAYRDARAADPSLPPMPSLLVVVDEFGELLASRPEFIDLFVALGRVGRSLGIHLLLCSQRLDEGRLRGLESHLRYRICLRTYSSVESRIVLGTPDAYLLPATPGLGYLKVDTDVYTRFKTALVSLPQRVEGDAEPVEEVRPFAVIAPAAAPAEERVAAAGDSDLEAIVERFQGAGPVHQVWLPPLASGQPLDAVPLAAPRWWEPGRPPGAGALRVAVGTVDRPAEQAQTPFVLDLAGAAGHLATVGAPQTGKTTFLRTLLASLLVTHTPDEAQVVVVDLGGGGLRALAGAPHVAAVCGTLDRELVRAVVRRVQAEIAARELAFRRRDIESIADVRARRARGEPEPGLFADLFLVIDNWMAFRREFEGLDADVEAIAGSGLNYGVHVILTANRWAEMRPHLRDNIGSRLELRLNDPIDSEVGRKAAQALPADVPGRGLTADALQVQFALPRVDGRDLATLAAEAAARWDGAPAPPVRTLPLQLSASELPAPGARGISIGIEESEHEPVWVDFETGDPHLLVLGDAESGKTNLVRLLLHGIPAGHAPGAAQVVLVDLRRGLIDVAAGPHVVDYAGTPPAVARAVGRVAEAVQARLPGGEASREELLGAPGWEGPHFYLLVDDYDLVASPVANPLAPLVELLALGRDVGLHVVVTRRVGGAARSAFEAFYQRLRELGTPGLVLSGDPQEGPLLGSQRATGQPPGRGWLVARNRRTALVQTALAVPHDASALAGAAPEAWETRT